MKHSILALIVFPLSLSVFASETDGEYFVHTNIPIPTHKTSTPETEQAARFGNRLADDFCKSKGFRSRLAFYFERPAGAKEFRVSDVICSDKVRARSLVTIARATIGKNRVDRNSPVRRDMKDLLKKNKAQGNFILTDLSAKPANTPGANSQANLVVQPKTAVGLK